MGKPLKKILIIGGLGYLGGRVAKYFSDNDYFVRITTRKSENDFPRNIPKNTKVIQVDYKSDEQLNEVMKGIDSLIHLAGPDAHTKFDDENILVKKHVDLTRQIFKISQRNNIKHFIYFSTIHVYGNSLVGTVTEEETTLPVYPFAIAHLEAEKIINTPQKEIVTIIFRCSNTFGAPYFENQKCWNLVVNDLCRSAFQNGSLIMNSSGQGYRDFISVGNVVNAIYYLTELKNYKGRDNIYNLGSSKTTRIIDIAKNIQKELKDRFDYNCLIKTNKSSNESINLDSFFFSTKKIKKLGFTLDYGYKEMRSLLNYCNNNHK